MPLKRRAARFLEGLEATGNVTLACEMAGIGRDRIYRHRRENPDFAAAWEAAKGAFAARAEADAEESGGGGVDLARLEREGMTIRRGRGGAVQIAAAHPLAWTAAREEAFFSAYAASGNVSAAARAAGFSGKAAWDRARTSPAFAERLAEAKRAATERLDFYLVEHGTNLLLGEDGARPDPQLAMWLLKRADQEKAGTLKRGAAAAVPRVATSAEVNSALAKALRAYRGRTEAKRLQEGWTRTAEGEWVPPGYGPLG